MRLLTQTIQWLLITLTLLSSLRCSKSPTHLAQGNGKLSINMTLNDQVTLMTKGGRQITASELHLDILKGETPIHQFYPIGTTNKEVMLDPGDYKVVAYSDHFLSPAFDTPVYGAQDEVSITSGGSSVATLNCKQINAGVRIRYTPGFLSAHTNYGVTITQNGEQLRFFGESATRTGYFFADYITLTLEADGRTTSQSFQLLPQRLYTVTISDEPTRGGGVGFNMSLSTLQIEEALTVILPGETVTPPPSPEGGTRSTLYQEDLGATHYPSGITVRYYPDWRYPDVLHAGSGVIVLKPFTPSHNYPGATGANAISFSSATNKLSLQGINTATYRDLELSFGFSSGLGSSHFSPTDLVIEYSLNTLSWNPLTHTSTRYDDWWEGKVSAGIPANSNLSLRFTTLKAEMIIDDLLLTGVH